eukprot:CAMPEP_0181175984 /NCGR_PEP_ID=MMETSP1096-20121128/4382_1 /TAXON_ID=156174 ORGANISM="Chrysochromulina ericina, Strain CCMP281" /NCGR_SAMPLE_ID=MMETSP1096 /ASSEMBLY_ACC=CAM_ASM_000453 /LENGTH=38 /DNA_ID= /DNA_START= /DNA_END= /DNA_ORIENTATION=
MAVLPRWTSSLMGDLQAYVGHPAKAPLEQNTSDAHEVG